MNSGRRSPIEAEAGGEKRRRELRRRRTGRRGHRQSVMVSEERRACSSGEEGDGQREGLSGRGSCNQNEREGIERYVVNLKPVTQRMEEEQGRGDVGRGSSLRLRLRAEELDQRVLMHGYARLCDELYGRGEQ